MAIRGSCLCGGVTFEIDRACGPAEYCHCNRCRKVSVSSSLLNIQVATKDYRFLSGRELVKTYAAPILYSPPAYHSYFCSTCGSQVPPPSPEGESFEIPAGLFDDDFGIRPDKHIFVDFMPPWDDLRQELPAYTLRQIYGLRTGRELPGDFQPRLHATAR
ncbi:MAG TPA: GFA family protein [Steroidobacteraceae bacterium]|nr:GFA family protein [Steroidobacteraceae bacterium]